MKKNILILAVILLLTQAEKVNAQQEGSLWINLQGGLNSVWILNQNAYGNPEIEYSTTFGFTGGGGVNYYFSNQWGFNASAMMTKLGQNYSGVQSGGDAERKVKLSYLEVPLLFMKHIPYTQNPTWIAFGPDILILLNAQQEYRRTGGDPLPNPEGMKVGDIRERFNPTDVALNFSINKLYRLDDSGKAMFLLSFCTAVGLTDINSVEWKTPNVHEEYGGSHNFYIGIKAGISFKASRDKK